MLATSNIIVQYGEKTIVNNVSFHLEENQWLMIVGPNGAGKSTLVNAISQSVPYSGQVLYRGKDVATLKPKTIAQNIGVLMQANHVNYSFSVEEVVQLGRYAWSQGFLSGLSEQDNEHIERALAITGLTPLRKQSITTLSGGELQRTFLAQIFAQDPHILILDEPANHLDLAYQKELFYLLQHWVKHPGRALISVCHDLSLAKTFGTHALLMNNGATVAQGDVSTALSQTFLNQAYHMDVYAWMAQLSKEWEHP